MGLLDPNIVEKEFGWPLKDLFTIHINGAGGICTATVGQELGEIVSPVKPPNSHSLETIIRPHIRKIVGYYAKLWHIDVIDDFRIDIKLNPFSGPTGAYSMHVIVNRHPWMRITMANK